MNYLEKLKPVALLLLRAALGIVFMAHGWPKLFDQNAGMQQFFSDHGLPASFVYLTGVLELFGGGLLILGLFTRAVAFLLAAEMGMAIWKVHLLKGYLAVREYEYPLVLFTACFALATIGAGFLSIDQPLFGGRKSGSRGSKKKTE